MTQSLGRSIAIRKLLGAGCSFLLAFTLSNCGGTATRSQALADRPRQTLEVMSLTWQKDKLFEENFFHSFGLRNGIETHYVPNARLALYQQLLRAHSGQPDLLEIDVVWPGILWNDLVDLRPYLKDKIKDYAPDLLNSYTVRGKLVAIPLFVDVGVLYYRPALLERYGFDRAPRDWDELEKMAARIQRGERQLGKKEFWGYLWQGSASEGGTCNALEWQSSAGAGNFIEPGGRVHVRSALFAGALARAVRWMGTISPPAEYVYWEDDAMNIWDEGQTAFMRNWASGYGHMAEIAGKNHMRFAVAPLPRGPGGHRGTLGGLGMAVSKYAANRDAAIKALLEITDEAHDLERLRMTGGIPTHSAVSARADVKSRNALLAISAELLSGLVARPSAEVGAKYDKVSKEYAQSVNSVLRRKEMPANALVKLEQALVRSTGLPAQRDSQ